MTGKDERLELWVALLRTSDACRIAKRSGGGGGGVKTPSLFGGTVLKNLSARKSDHALVELVPHVLQSVLMGAIFEILSLGQILQVEINVSWERSMIVPPPVANTFLVAG